MQSLFGKLLVALALFSLSACDEPETPTRVWGIMRTDLDADQGSATAETTEAWEVNGGILGSGEGVDLYGHCTYEDGVFSFEIASRPPGQLSGHSKIFSLSGIRAEPSENPYDASGNLRSNENHPWQQGRIRQGNNDWTVTSTDAITGRCPVSLFAVASEGNLTPVKYGKENFQYVVRVSCQGGLDRVQTIDYPDNANLLTGMEMELWFINCTE